MWIIIREWIIREWIIRTPKRYAKKIAWGRRLLVEPQGCGGQNKKNVDH
jgi:hypothetical protein